MLSADFEASLLAGAGVAAFPDAAEFAGFAVADAAGVPLAGGCVDSDAGAEVDAAGCASGVMDGVAFEAAGAGTGVRPVVSSGSCVVAAGFFRVVFNHARP